jgi:CBS domain-containing protein
MPESTTEPLAFALGQAIKRLPVACLPGETVRRAIQTMRELSIGSMVVVDSGRTPLGILTLRDIADRVALEPDIVDGPIERVMTRSLVTLPVGETAYDAALVMIRHGVRHIVLVDGGRLAGIVSERDLFGLQSTSLRQLSTAIRGAQDLPAIEAFGRDIRELARKMLAQGVAAGPLSAFIASLNDLLTQRIVDWEFRDTPARYCWILMGSEGRSEQTLITDQDNGLIFAPAPGTQIEHTRHALLGIARRVNQALHRAGYRLCPGDIMAGNPQWCLTLDEWRGKFGRWIDAGSPDALLHGSIFFDLRPLHGELELARELRRWLLEHAPRNPRFLRQMAENALKNRPPLGLLRDFKLDDSGLIDLKLNGTMPFVDAARIHSLACGIDETNTERRIAGIGPALNIAAHETDAWIAAYQHVQGHRLRCQAAALNRFESAGNRIDPRLLHDFDREVLKLAFRQAVTLQERLALDYQL